jgi:uncharacterized protein DUF2188
MPDITIQRHGDRWALQEAGAESPSQEFATREAAELAARDLAAGGAVEVREDDPTGLGEGTAGEPESQGLGQVDAVSARERARSTQTGL